MALTVGVTKLWPVLEGAGQIRIGAEVVLNDDDTEHRMTDTLEQKRKSFTTNTEKTADPEVQAGLIIAEMNAWIQGYKDEKVAFNHAKMGAFITAINEGAIL